MRAKRQLQEDNVRLRIDLFTLLCECVAHDQVIAELSAEIEAWINGDE